MHRAGSSALRERRLTVPIYDRLESVTYEIKEAIEIDGAPASVYQALMDEGAIRSWWTSEVTAEPDDEADLELAFYHRAIVLRLVVEDAYEKGRVDWRCIEGPAEYRNCTIVFRLEPAVEKTRLEVTHAGENGTDEFVEHGKESWRNVLRSLKSFVETGQGTPLSE